MHFVDVSTELDEHIMVLGVRCVDNIAKEEIEKRKPLRKLLKKQTGQIMQNQNFFPKCHMTYAPL